MDSSEIYKQRYALRTSHEPAHQTAKCSPIVLNHPLPFLGMDQARYVFIVNLRRFIISDIVVNVILQCTATWSGKSF